MICANFCMEPAFTKKLEELVLHIGFLNHLIKRDCREKSMDRIYEKYSVFLKSVEGLNKEIGYLSEQKQKPNPPWIMIHLNKRQGRANKDSKRLLTEENLLLESLDYWLWANGLDDDYADEMKTIKKLHEETSVSLSLAYNPDKCHIPDKFLESLPV